jgi:CheY-like chemotaxis protein
LTFDLLLADASPMMQRIVELTFAGSGVHVSAVRDGEEAIRRIAAAPPDIVLADHALAKRSGYEISAFVKGRSELAHIPVLLLAGAFEPVDQIRAAQVGCDGVIGKPFEPQQLTARVRDLLARASARHDDQTAPEPAVPASPDGGERDSPQGEDAATPTPVAGEPDEDAGIPTISGLLATTSPAAAAPSDGAAPDAESGSAEGPGTTEPSHPRRPINLTDLRELAEALGAWRTPAAPSDAVVSDAASAARFGDAFEAGDPDVPPLRPGETESASGQTVSRESTAWLELGSGENPAPPPEPATADASASEPGVAAPSPQTHAPVLSEPVIEEVTRRVIERLGSTAMQDVAARVVSQIAERLLREELERIRRAAGTAGEAH